MSYFFSEKILYFVHTRKKNIFQKTVLPFISLILEGKHKRIHLRHNDVCDIKGLLERSFIYFYFIFLLQNTCVEYLDADYRQKTLSAWKARSLHARFLSLISWIHISYSSYIFFLNKTFFNKIYIYIFFTKYYLKQ